MKKHAISQEQARKNFRAYLSKKTTGTDEYSSGLHKKIQDSRRAGNSIGARIDTDTFCAMRRMVRGL